jgi:hypothetical protein
MFGDQAYSFSGAWISISNCQIKDLWEHPRQDWKSIQDLVAMLKQRGTEGKRSNLINAGQVVYETNNAFRGRRVGGY